MGVVHRSRGALAPATPHLRSEPAIVCGLGRALFGAGGPVDWEGLAADHDRIRELIALVVPDFHGFNERVRHDAGFVLPNPARERDFARVPGARARFTVHPIPTIDLAPGQLLMTTVRTHDQFNTTVYDTNDRYRGVHGHRRVVLMNPADVAARGLAAGQRVTLVSVFRGERRSAPDFVVVPYDVPPGSAATYFPEANVLVPVDHFADRSRTPASKSVVIEVHTRR
jgi:anaerobic selenocysteine-containing dehydrogenase